MNYGILIQDRFLNDARGTVGVIRIPGELKIYTLEPPWADNIRFQSCIPPGIYPLTPGKRDNGRKVIRLGNVADRDGIEIHTGNERRETEGCILVGMSVTITARQYWLSESAQAYEHLLEFCKRWSDPRLIVRWYAYRFNLPTLTNEV